MRNISLYVIVSNVGVSTIISVHVRCKGSILPNLGEIGYRKVISVIVEVRQIKKLSSTEN